MTGPAWLPSQAPANLRAARLAEIGSDALRAPHSSLVQRCQRELSALVPEARAACLDPALVILGALSILASEVGEAERASRESEVKLAVRAAEGRLRERVRRALE